MTDQYFDSSEKSLMQSCQVGFMQDTCVIQTLVQTANTYGELVETFTDGSAIECGLDMRPGSERRGRDNIITEWDATLRLAIARVPDSKDRIKITKRFGTAISPELVYEIVSPVQKGVSGIRILLRKVLQ